LPVIVVLTIATFVEVTNVDQAWITEDVEDLTTAVDDEDFTTEDAARFEALDTFVDVGTELE
jgi:hypothetical protein